MASCVTKSTVDVGNVYGTLAGARGEVVVDLDPVAASVGTGANLSLTILAVSDDACVESVNRMSEEV